MAAMKHLGLLDTVQDGAAMLITDNKAGPVLHLNTLQDGPEISGLTVVFKVQEKHVIHLQELRQPKYRDPIITRTVALALSELLQFQYSTWHHQRQFKNFYTG